MNKASMPKLQEHFGPVVVYYEHEPVHGHGNCHAGDTRPEVILLDGVVRNICCAGVAEF